MDSDATRQFTVFELNGSRLKELNLALAKQAKAFHRFRIYQEDTVDKNVKEQDEIVKKLKKKNGYNIKGIKNDLRNLKPKDSEQVEFKGKKYRRDNKTIAQIKILRDFKCQLCHKRIKKNNGDWYVEAAHIRPKCEEGPEAPSNILILCPNHHKEFDFGTKEIYRHDKRVLDFKLNNGRYLIKLTV